MPKIVSCITFSVSFSLNRNAIHAPCVCISTCKVQITHDTFTFRFISLLIQIFDSIHFSLQDHLLLSKVKAIHRLVRIIPVFNSDQNVCYRLERQAQSCFWRTIVDFLKRIKKPSSQSFRLTVHGIKIEVLFQKFRVIWNGAHDIAVGFF